MGNFLGEIIQNSEGPHIFQLIEQLRGQAKSWRESKDATKFQELSHSCQQLTTKELHVIARAFTHFLAMANAAEAHHRTRILNQRKQYDGTFASPESMNALSNKSDSCGGVLKDLITNYNLTPEDVVQQLAQQKVELVLTAHPTEVNRRTNLEKQRRIQKILTMIDELRFRETSTLYEETQLEQALKRELSSLWLSDEVSRTKPTPENEAERGTLVVETVLWDALPTFLRKLDATLQSYSPDAKLPLTAAPIIFSSWMGGDRDGNPNVTAKTTQTVCMRQRSQAAWLLRQDLQKLERELSLVTCSDELHKANGDGNAREPYRTYIRKMVAKMKRTQEWTRKQKEQTQSSTGSMVIMDEPNTTVDDGTDIYLSKQVLLDELLLMHRSLCEMGDELHADGMLTDILRKVSSFGLTMVPLDIRQESDRHEEALDAITRYLGLGSFSQWDEDTKLSWLQQQLGSKRPLIRPGVWNDHPDIFTDTTIDTLETFQMIAQQHEDSLGAYVISQCTTASDILTVLLLQRDAGVATPLRVVPLFETLDDLNGATDTMRQLYSIPAYMGSIGGKQEVMIGYSDSAKDAGRLAASWAQYETQEALAKLSREMGVDLTFFHGKGGTVGRGGNPQTFLAILAHAPDTINGKFRVTEQGEMITQNFGYKDRAERTMDIYTAAVLAEKLADRAKPTPEWRQMMARLSDASCDAYRQVVREDDRFVPYFRSATPELELSNLNIGSRPAKRKATGGVESLRAIPWNFSWTQTRLNLPTWLGVGQAVDEVLNSDPADAALLRDMYKNWGSFRTTIDLVEMVLAKSEPDIAAHYDDQLVKDPKAQELGQEVRTLHRSTEKAILDLTEHEVLSENNAMLRRLLQVRNPYVDVLNVLQAETLKRIRELEAAGKEEDKILKDALLTTITGIANGMGNTG